METQEINMNFIYNMISVGNALNEGIESQNHSGWKTP